MGSRRRGRRGARGGRPAADRGADEGAQEETPLGAFQERGEVLVDRRVLDQSAQRALARLDPSRDGAEVGHRLAEVGQRLAELRVAAESLGELTEARQRLRRLLDALLSPGLRERPEHALAPDEPPGHLTEASRRLAEVRRERRVLEQGAEHAVLGAGALDGLREPVGRRHHPAHGASRVRIPEEHAQRALAPLDAGEQRAGPREHALEILQDPPLVVHERVEDPPAFLDLAEDAVHPLRGRPRLGEGPLRLARQPGRPRIGEHAIDPAHGLADLPERLARVRERRPELPIVDEPVEDSLPPLDLGRETPERPHRLGGVGARRSSR